MKNQANDINDKERSEDVRLCLDCGSEMKEAHRSKENGILFVWYECSGSNCDEQFLLRTSQPIGQMGMEYSKY